MKTRNKTYRDITRFFALILAFALLAGAFASPVSAQRSDPLVSISRRGSGTAAVPSGGAYLYNDMKVVVVAIDGTSLTSTLSGGKIRLTFPKNYFQTNASFYTVDTAGNSLAKGKTVTSDANNIYVDIPLKDITTVTKGTFDVVIQHHRENVVPTGAVVSPKTELFASDGTLVHEAAPMTDPLILGNRVSSMYLYRTAPIHETGNASDGAVMYAGAAATSGSFTYIDPAQTVPLRFHVSTVNPPNYGNAGAHMRLFPKGTGVIDLPTYPCVDMSSGTAVASTCTAVFDAALSPGWTQVGNQIFLNFDVNGEISDPLNKTQVSNAIVEGLNNKAYYFRFPNAIVNRDITLNGALKDLEPVNYDPNVETLSNFTDTLKFKLSGTITGNFSKEREWPDTRNYSIGSLDLTPFNYWIQITNRNSSGIHINKVTDFNLDPRLYVKSFRFRSNPQTYQQTIVQQLKVHAYKADGSGYDEFTVTPSTSATDTYLLNIEPEADAAVAAQVAAADAGADYATLGGNTRKYDRFEFIFDAGETLPAGWTFSIGPETRLLNPYQETFHQYPLKPNSTVLDQPAMTCKADGSGSANLNAFCNYASIDQELILPTGTVSSTQSVPSKPIWYTYTPPFVLMESAGINQSATQIGTGLDARTYLQLCNFPGGFVHKNLTVTALFPPGAAYSSYMLETWNGGGNNNELAALVDSATTIPNFQGTGLTAVQVKLKDFKHRDVWDGSTPNGCVSLRVLFRSKITEDAIPMPLVPVYEANNAAQAGQIPSNKANEMHFFWTWDNVTSITKEANVSGKLYAAKDAAGNFVFGIGNGDDSNPAHNPNTYPRPDVIDANGDGANSDLIMRMSGTFNATIPTVVNAEKFIFSAGTPVGKSDAPVPLNGPYTYRVQVNNMSTIAEGNVLIYDVLPRIGDSNYVIAGSSSPARNSQFDAVMTGPATGNATDKYDIKYCTSPNPSMDPVVGVQDAANGGCAWQDTAADWKTVTAVRIQLKPGEKIDPLMKDYFDLPMLGPDTTMNYETGYDTSSNSFAVSYSMGSTFGTSNSVTGVKNISFPVKKIWKDGETRPDITIDLYANNVKVSDKSLTLKPENADPNDPNIWVGEFTNLPSVNASGARITYTVKENREGANTAALKDYTSTITGSVALVGDIEGYTIENQYVQPVIAIAAQKVWENGQSIRQNITLTLQRKLEGSTDDPEDVPASELRSSLTGQTCEMTNPATLTPSTATTSANATQTIAKTWCVPETSIAGKKYVYTVKETLPDADKWTVAYESTPASSAAPQLEKITNTYKVPTFTAANPLVGTAAWINGPAAKPEAYMLLSRTVPGGTAETVGDPVDISTASVIGTATDETNGDKKWVVTKNWDDLPMTDTMGRPYTYSLTETDANKVPLVPAGYAKTGEGTMNLVNTYQVAYVEVTGTKVWDGASTLKRPALTLGLYVKTADGRFVTPETIGGNLLPTDIYKTGTTPSVTYQTAGKIEIPESTGPVTTPQTFYWFVPKTYRNGDPIVYYFDEQLGDGLTPTGDPLSSTLAPTQYRKEYQYDAAAAAAYGEMKILNTYVPPLINGDGKVVGDVKWVGGTADDRDSVTIELKRKRPNGAVEVVGTVTLNKTDAATHNWVNTWDDQLPKTDQATGEEFTYWIDDTAAQTNFDKVLNATTPTVITENRTLTLTYRYRSPRIAVPAAKEWSGGTNLIPRPTVTLSLYRHVAGETAVKVPANELFTDASHSAPEYSTVNGVQIAHGDPLTVKWFTNEKNPDGIAYIFTVDEDSVPANYVKDVNDSTLTVKNTYQSPLYGGDGNVKGSVVWVGGSEADRSDVTLTLYRKTASGSVETIGTTTLAKNDAGTHGWETTWSNQPLNDQATGDPYTYWVDEGTVPENFEKVDNAANLTPITDNTTLTVTNRYVSPPSVITATKIWDGGSARPAVEITLYREITINGAVTKEAVPAAALEAGADLATANPVTLNGAPWTVSWKTPSTNADGIAYTFSIDETTVPTNYVKTVNNTAYTITNKYVSPIVEKLGKKTWVKGNLLRTPIELTLFRTTTPADLTSYAAVPASDLRTIVGSACETTNPVTLTPSTALVPDTVEQEALWCVDETDGDGAAYSYIVRETSAAVAGFTKVENGLTVTNTFASPKRSVEGTLTWIGGPDTKPNVTITLKRTVDGGATTETVVPNVPMNGVTVIEWPDLPTHDEQGRPYTYTIHNDQPVNHFSVTENGLAITYRYQVPVENKTGRKTWVNGNVLKNEVRLAIFRRLAGTADEYVQLTSAELIANAANAACAADVSSVNPVTLTPTTNLSDADTFVMEAKWCVESTDSSARPYEFIVREVNPAAAMWTKVENGLEVTNTFTPALVNGTGNLELTKKWEGGQPVTVSFTLKRTTDGVTEETIGTYPLTAGDAIAARTWRINVPNMTTHDLQGRAYTYKVYEDTVPANFTAQTDQASLTVTNRYIVPRANLTITVNWNGGPAITPATHIVITDNQGNTYFVDFAAGDTTPKNKELPITDNDGNNLTYTIRQSPVPDDFEETIDQPAGIELSESSPNNLSLTNQYVPPVSKVQATKIWANGENAPKPTIWFKLYRTPEGGVLEEVPLSEAPLEELAEGDTVAEWLNMPEYSLASERYTYEVKEVDASGDTAWEPENWRKTENGLTVTNEYVPPTAPVMGSKVWGRGPSPRPTVYFKLTRRVGTGPIEVIHGGEAGSEILELADPAVSVTWPDVVQTTLNGSPYAFFVQEVDVNGDDYVPDGYVKSEIGTTVTNAGLSNLTIAVEANPLSDTKFKVTVVSDADPGRPEAELDWNGEETVTPSSVTHEKVKPTLYRIQLPDLDFEDWRVESIQCLSKPLGDAGDYTDEVTIHPQLSMHGNLTGLFSIDPIPLESDIKCTYKLKSNAISTIIVKNITYANPNVNGGLFPDYHYGVLGTGLSPFTEASNGSGTSTDVAPGTYKVAQQNLDGWVTIDTIVSSSFPARNPLLSKAEQAAGEFSFPNGGVPAAGYTETGFDSVSEFTVQRGETVTVTFVNVPPNTVVLKKVTIPAGASERFPIAGLFEGTIGNNQILIRTDIQPGTGNREVVKELPFEGWTKHSVSCVEVGPINETKSFGDLYTMEAWYGLDEGEVVMCTFVNRAYGSDEEDSEIFDPDIPGITDKGVAGGGFYADGLPRTGFSPNRVTALPEQTAAKRYQASELTLSIPKLGLSMNIAGVPVVDGEWDVSWLGGQAGYLVGTAYPTHGGNSVITAHVWDAYNNPGPFANLKTLAYGDQFEIAAYGKTYVYEVRDSKRVSEGDVAKVTAAKDGTWVTLLTCEDYSEASGDYRYRRAVEAILIEVR